MKKLTTLLYFLSILCAPYSYAAIYEDAEDGTANKWLVYDKTPSGATITNVYDYNKKSKVIELKGSATANGYRLGHYSNAWNNKYNKVIKWSMNYKENFVVYISTKTKKGHRYLYYTARNTDAGMHSNGEYIHHGIGVNAKNGTWQTFHRDLEADLKEFESDNELISINAFLIRGSGRIDDVEIVPSIRTIYEDAEDGTANKWHVYDKTPSGATITNVYDYNKKSKVIELKGSATANGYRLGHDFNSNAWNNKDNKVIKWSMNYKENFVVYISTKTKKGHRYLYYTARNTDAGLNRGYIHHGIGVNAKNGTWQTFHRDLEADLKEFESDNELISINAFLIRGNGRIDDVEIVKDLPPPPIRTIYEDAEDGTANKWHVYDKTPSGATITNVYDDNKKSKVIELKGSATANGYRLGHNFNFNAWNNKYNKVIKWSMNYKENFVVYISTRTKKGHRYLYYTAKNTDAGMNSNGGYIHHGIGVNAKNGTWQTFHRDLEADLKEFESDNELISINAFLIRGSGRIDDVEIVKTITDTQKPIINIIGELSKTINIGETYIDEGATATDNMDGNITDKIIVTNLVDSNKLGTYKVKYNVKDSSDNNAAEIMRTVIVIYNTPPVTPSLTDTPTTTNTNSVEVEVNGEINSKVFVNGIDTSKVILESGKVNITLDTSGADGDKIFNITLKDSFDNESEILTLSIIKDTVKPSVEVNKEEGKYEEPIGVILKANKDEIIYYTTDGTLPLKGNAGTISFVETGTVFITEPTTLQYYAIDKATNISDVKSLRYILPDKYAPTVKLVTPINNSILYNTKPTIQLELKDASGIDYTTLKLFIDEQDISNNIIINNNIISYTPNEPFSDKKINIYLEVKDNTGNTTVKYYNFTIDSSELVLVNSHQSGYYQKPFYFRLFSNRPSKIYYTTDGSSPVKDNINTKVADSPLENIHIYETSHLKYFAEDNFNNKTEIKTIDLYFDKKSPEVTLSSIQNNDYINTLKPNINISYIDESSGIDVSKIDFKINGFSKRNTANINATNLSYTPLFDLNEDINTMELFLVDKVGNSRYYLYSFRLDITQPISTISYKEGKYNKDINLSITSSEISYIYYTLDGSEPVINESQKVKLPINIEIKQNTTLKYIVQDLAKNLEVKKEYKYEIDKEIPNQPENLVAKFKDKRVELLWNNVIQNDIAGYNIYRKIENNNYLKINSSLITQNSYIDINAPQSTLYYKTTSVDISTNESTYSNEVSGILQNLPPKIILDTNETSIITNNEIFELTGSIEDASSIKHVKVNNIIVNSTNNYKTWDFSQNLAEGNNSLKIEAVDEYDNISTKDILVQLDTVAAKTTSSISSGIYNSIQSIILSSNESNATIYYTLDGSIPTSSSGIVYAQTIENITENTVVKYMSIDKANNIESVQTIDLEFAFKKPKISSSLDTQTVLLSSKPTFKFTYFVYDNELVKEKTKITLDSNDITNIVTISENSFIFTPVSNLSDGKHTISLYLEDQAGNNVQESYSFTIDSLESMTTINFEGNHFFNPKKNIELKLNKEGTIYYTLDGNTPTPDTNYTYSGVNEVNITINDTTTIKYFGIDFFGRKELSKTKTFILDETAPTVTLVNPNNNQSTNNNKIEVLLEFDDEAGIDLSKSIFKIDNIDISNLLTSSTVRYGKTWSEGAHSIYIKIYDNVGNITENTYSFILDTKAPEKSVLTNPTPESTRDNKVAIEITGEPSSEVFINGISTNIFIPESGKLIFDIDTSGDNGEKNFQITLKDNAGNISEVLVFKIDKKPSLPVFTNQTMESWNTVGIEGFSKGKALSPSIAIDKNNTPYVVYSDYGNSGKATVKKFDGNSWVTVGVEGFSKDEVSGTSIAIDNNNITYVAYQDHGNSGKATVKKFDGNSWVTVGVEGFSKDGAYHTSIAIDNNNTPYVVYGDGGNSSKATVKKFNGNSWITVGVEGFSKGKALYTLIAIDNNNIPYVVYVDVGNSYKATVKKFDGNSWVTVGVEGFSKAEVCYTSIAIDNNNIPYVVYEDGGNLDKATVKKFDGNSWVTVGVEGFSKANVYDTSIAIDNNNIPYVVYRNYGKATVKKFNGNSWVTVGVEGFSKDKIHDTSIAIDNNNILYVVYDHGGNSNKATVKEFILSINNSIIENHIKAIDINAIDINNDKLTYSLLNFLDFQLFNINIDTGVVSFKTAPNFEGPIDLDKNNIYEFYVKVVNTYGGSATQLVKIIIEDEDEDDIVLEKIENQAIGVGHNLTLKLESTTNLIGNISYEAVSSDPDKIKVEITGDILTITTLVNESINIQVTVTSYLDGSSDTKIFNVKKEYTPIKITNLVLDWNTVGSEGFSKANVFNTSIAIDNNNIPYVVYADYGNSGKATVKKFDGNSWVTVGVEGFSKDQVSYTSIAIDNNNIPYVVYEDWGNLDKATVKKFDGNSWVTVGVEGFSKAGVSNTSIAIDNNNIPYVVYEDWGNLNRATVKKFDGNSWVTVGVEGFSKARVRYISIAIDNNNIPYVVYRDDGNLDKATVKKFDGNSWVTVGVEGFSKANVYYTSIAIDNNNIPYVVYRDYGNLDKATVKKFDGNSWVTVGVEGFSKARVRYISIAIDNNNIPYVAYTDDGNSEKATVKKFDGNSWVTVGVEWFSKAGVSNISIAIGKNNILYVVYPDGKNSGKATVKRSNVINQNIIENHIEVIDIDAIDYFNTKLTYSLEDSKDSDLFNINNSTGIISFKIIPDYENPKDLDKDNTYLFDINITNENGEVITKRVNIHVKDEAENSSLPAKPVLKTNLFYTNSNSKNIDVYGEVGTYILVNGINTNITIPQNTIATLAVDTSGVDGEKAFNISSKRVDGTISPSVSFSVIKDTVKPYKPIVSQVPTYVSNNNVEVEINGEPGTIIFINNISTGIIIGQNGKIVLYLNTTGSDEEKSFDISLMDKALNKSDTINVKITKDSIAPLKPQITSVPSSTKEETVEVEVSGEIGSTIIVNAVSTNKVIDTDGKATIVLNTSGAVGNKVFDITLRDAASNTSEVLNIIIKKDPPQSIVFPDAGAYNKDIIVNIKSEAATSIYYTMDGTTPDKNSSSNAVGSVDINITKNTTIKYFSIDLSGNIEAIKTKEFIIDKINPIITSPIDDIYTQNSKEKLLIEFSDENSGINLNKSIFTIDNKENNNIVATNNKIEFETTWSEAKHIIYLKLYDHANNFIEKSFTFTLDTTPPQTIITPDAGSYNTLTVNLMSEPNAMIYYTINGENPTKETSLSAMESVNIDVNSTAVIKYFSIDKAGNVENIKTKEFIIDNEKPKLVSGITEPVNYISKQDANNIFYTFTDNDNIKSITVLTASGRVYDNFSLIGNNSMAINFKPNSYGEYSFVIKVIDAAGNITLIPVKFFVDLIAPNTVASLQGGKYNKVISVELVSNKETTIYYSTNGYPPIVNASNTKSGSSPVVGIDINSTTSLQFFSIDKTGNKEEVKSEVYRFDDIEESEFSLTAVYDKDGKNVKLSWNYIDKSKEYTIFRVNNIIEKNILQHSKDSKYLAPEQYTISNSSNNNYTDTNILNGSKYYYAVSRINNQGVQGIISNIVSVDIAPKDIAVDVTESILRAKNYLFATQDENGYWSKNNKLKLLATTEVLNSLYEYKDENPASFNLSTSYIYRTYSNNNDFLARKIITLSDYEFYIDGLINKLVAQGKISSTYIYGWGINRDYKIDVLDTVLGMKAISKAKNSLSKVNGGVYYLKNDSKLKSKEGYWGWISKDDTSIFISSSVYSIIKAQKTEYQWIIDSQNADGSFGNGLLDTLGVILNLEIDAEVLEKSIDYILSQQNINGHWKDDPYLTALCLQALKKDIK